MKKILILALFLLSSVKIFAQQAVPAIDPFYVTEDVIFTVDSTSNKDRTHQLKVIFKENHGFNYYTIRATSTKLCTDGNINDTLINNHIIFENILASTTEADTLIFNVTNQLSSFWGTYPIHSLKLYYTCLLSNPSQDFRYAITPQGPENNTLGLSHNSTFMLPMKITADSAVNYDKVARINIHSEWKPNSTYWFNPTPPSGQIYSSSLNNVGRYELWECTSSGQLLYPVTTFNYFQNNLFISPGPMGNFGNDKLWARPTVTVPQTGAKYYKIKSVEVYDSCNTHLSDLLTVRFATKQCSTTALSVINSTKANFEYRFSTLTSCPRTGWEARFYRCIDGNGLFASNPSLSQVQVGTLPLAKVQYKNAEIETLSSTRILLTQTEVNQGFFRRKASPKLVFGNCWYRIDIVCAGCNSPTNIRTIYTYVTN